ncbi:MAG: ABC transporter permease [Candidatus Acidiferrales bacterium]
MKRHGNLRLAVAVLVGFHVAALFAGFFAPYGYATQDREMPFASPTRIHFLGRAQSLRSRPFVYLRTERPGELEVYEEDPSHAYPVRFFVIGARYKIAGLIPSQRHLFGVDAPARIFLFGTDDFGRDQFSRFLYGGQISLFAGTLGAGICLILGTALGTLSGFYGRWLDAVVMRGAELFMALPWLYLLLAVRAILPLRISTAETFLLLVSVIGLVGWARPARLLRGVVLSAKERNYVLAARALGATNLYILRRHVLPQAYGVILTQAALLVPQFILAEVTLSFMGLGVGEPIPSWGALLANLVRYDVLASRWWMFLPALVLVPLFFSYHVLANALQERLRLVNM